MFPALRKTFSSLRHRNFRLFFIGQSISNSGNWLTNVALTLLVLRLTATGVGVGLLIACQFGPLMVLSAWAGTVADHLRRAREAPSATGCVTCSRSRTCGSRSPCSR
jgi:hypothetical protein